MLLELRSCMHTTTFVNTFLYNQWGPLVMTRRPSKYSEVHFLPPKNHMAFRRYSPRWPHSVTFILYSDNSVVHTNIAEALPSLICLENGRSLESPFANKRPCLSHVHTASAVTGISYTKHSIVPSSGNSYVEYTVLTHKHWACMLTLRNLIDRLFHQDRKSLATGL